MIWNISYCENLPYPSCILHTYLIPSNAVFWWIQCTFFVYRFELMLSAEIDGNRKRIKVLQMGFFLFHIVLHPYLWESNSEWKNLSWIVGHITSLDKSALFWKIFELIRLVIYSRICVRTWIWSRNSDTLL